jgi:hypothetical protein
MDLSPIAPARRDQTMARSSKQPRDPATLSPQELLAIVASIQVILWRQPEGDWDADKEWNSASDYIDAVADTLIRAGLRPA